MDIMKRIELETRKEILKVAKEMLKEGVEIKTYRGTYTIDNKVILYIIKSEIERKIEEVDSQLEELTGIDYNELDKLYEV